MAEWSPMMSDEHGRCRHDSTSSACQFFHFKSDMLQISVNDLQFSCQRINGGRPPQGNTTSPLLIGGPLWKVYVIQTSLPRWWQPTFRYRCIRCGGRPTLWQTSIFNRVTNVYGVSENESRCNTVLKVFQIAAPPPMIFLRVKLWWTSLTILTIMVKISQNLLKSSQHLIDLR